MIRTVHQLADLGAGSTPVVLAAGAFDGVHRGHQMLLQRALAEAHARGGQAWVLTFDPHPSKVLRPEEAPLLLSATPHKLRLLGGYPLAGCVIMPFTRELSLVSASDFLARLRAEIPSLSAIVVGANWRFGHHARGDAKLLTGWGESAGVDTVVLERLLWHGKPISSTRIREAVQAGHLDQAEAMLGRPFSIYGPVVHGDQVGRQLGFPTANVEPFNEVRPPPGIYAVRTRLGERALGGAAYVPDRPGTEKMVRGIVEVHLLDFDEDIYGVDLEVHFARKLRDDLHFPNLDALKEQIGRDVQQVRVLLQHAV